MAFMTVPGETVAVVAASRPREPARSRALRIVIVLFGAACVMLGLVLMAGGDLIGLGAVLFGSGYFVRVRSRGAPSSDLSP